MKRKSDFTTLSISLTALLFVTFPSCEKGSLRIPYPENEMKAGIRDVLDSQVKSWNDGDIEGFMEGYRKSPDVVFTAGGKISRGWQTVLDKYKRSYTKENMGQLEFSDVEITILGQDAALVFGKWKLTRENDTPNGVFSLVLTPSPEGWRIIHDHTSASIQDEE